MDKHITPPISVEKFAAYLDGNLLPEEMQEISSVIAKDEMMHGIMNASDLADATLATYAEEDLSLPEEIASMDFDLPYENMDNHIDDNIYDVAACAAADINDELLGVSFEDENHNDKPVLDDDSSLDNTTVLENDSSDITSIGDNDDSSMFDPNDL